MKQENSMINEATKKVTSSLNSLKAPIGRILESKDVPTLREWKEESNVFLEKCEEVFSASKKFLTKHKWKAAAIAGVGIVATGAFVMSSFFKANPPKPKTQGNPTN